MIANADVAERQRPGVVALEPMCPRVARPNVRPVRELGRLHLGFPVGTPQLVLDAAFTPFSQCSTCAPVATMRALFHSPTGFRWPAATDRGHSGAGTREPRLVVVAVDVVEQLIFGRARVDVLVSPRCRDRRCRCCPRRRSSSRARARNRRIRPGDQIADVPVFGERSALNLASRPGSRPSCSRARRRSDVPSKRRARAATSWFADARPKDQGWLPR